MKADADTEAAVMGAMYKAAEAISRRDLDAVLQLFAPDPDLVIIGTGADEKRVGLAALKAQLERDFSQSEAGWVQFGWTLVSAAGSVAWVAADMTIHVSVGGQQVSFSGRLTAVLERRGDRWLFVQWHFSLPALGQAEGESWPTAIDAVLASVQSERPDLRPRAAPDGTVTMLFTDIEGSTSITERLGDERWLEVLRAHNGIIREQVQAYGCFEVKCQGDGFMIASQSARRALRCAVDIQRAIAAYDETAPEPIRVRIGLHTGEVVKDADDFFGKHVILASRIANEAQGGEILSSALLKELAESAGEIQFGRGREVELKGLSGKHRIFEVRWQEEGA